MSKNKLNMSREELAKFFLKYNANELEAFSSIFEYVYDYDMDDVIKVFNAIYKIKCNEYDGVETSFVFTDLSKKNNLLSNKELEFLKAILDSSELCLSSIKHFDASSIYKNVSKINEDVYEEIDNRESKKLVTHVFPIEVLGNGREEYLSKEATFMGMATLIANRSKDPNTQVGVCYVGEDDRVISMGYNGTPKGWDDSKFPWGKDMSLGEENTKYPYVVHAEKNGIANYVGPQSHFIGSTAYVTVFPCPDCTKTIIQAGVKKIVYLSNKYKDTKDALISRTMLEQCGVEYKSFEELNKDNVEEITVPLMEVDKGVMVKKLKREQ